MKQTNCTQINNQPKIQCLHRTTEGNNIAALHLVCEVGKDDVRYLSSICEVLWHWIYHKSSKETHIIACTSSVQVLHVKLGLVWEWWCVLNLLKKKKRKKKRSFWYKWFMLNLAWLGNGDICVELCGFFLACRDFGRIFHHSFLSSAFFFFLKWRLACAHYFHSLSQDQSTVAQRDKMTVANVS